VVVNQLGSATTSVHPGMGANLFDDECSFRVWAPNAIAVSVCIWRNERMSQVSLAPESSNPSYWSVDVADVVAGQPYQFSIVNKGGDPSNPGGIFTRVDTYARQVESAEDNARGIIVDWQQQWSEFATPKFADLIIYEAHVGSFAGLNDHLNISTYATFADFETKLGYIRELGFNALQLLPTEQVDGIDGEGYGATNLFAPHNGYGTPADLRWRSLSERESLVDAAHRHDLAVIFDVVYHHASTSRNHYWQYDGNTTDGGGIYFEDPFHYEPARDEDGRSFAHWKSEVQNFLLDHARMMLNEYRGDGLRFDMAHTLTCECTQHIIAGLHENPYWRDKYLIAEWTSEQQDRWGKVIRELGFNAVWGMSDPFAFIRAMNGENTIDNLKSFIGWTGLDRPWNFIRYLLGSHDRIADSQSGKQTENRYFVELCGGRDNWYARAKVRLGWALNVAMPGTPMLFMGSECHHPGYWWPNPDRNPSTSEHRFDWGIAGDSIAIPMRNLVKDINWIRWHNLALRSDTLQFIHEDRTNTVLAFKRWHESGNIIVVVVNLSDRQWQEHDYGIHMGGEIGRWEEIFNSQSPQYGGWNDSGNYGRNLQVQADGKIYINLPKWSVLIFRKQ
jgi:1,4-alpha-glucan branching enzyme